jgi:hypothetical protein
LVQKIIPNKNDYGISYELTEKKHATQIQFMMTIAGSKQLLDNLQLDNLEKGNWQPTIEEGWFFYRTK